jgi:hypothetical protein
LGKAQKVRANRKRMIQIGDYEFQRYGEHKELMKIIAFTSLGIIISVALLKKEVIPKHFAQAGIVASGAAGSIFLIYQLIDMWYRNNMDYNKYNFGFWYEPGPPEAWGKPQESIWEVNKRGASKIFWGNRGTDEEQDEAKSDLAKITGNDEGPSDNMVEDGAGTGQPDNYEEQLYKLFSKTNCPEGARVRGYCSTNKPDKSGDGGDGYKGGDSGGDSSPKLRPSLVGNASKWKGLEFENQHSAEGFKDMGTAAGAGKNFNGVVIPFGGF